jgi:hypothetical protein
MAEEKKVKIKNVDQIKVNLLRPSQSAYFYVELPLTQFSDVDDTINKSFSKIERLGLNCSSAVLPGSRLTTYQIDNDRTGVTETHAYRRQFDQEIDFEFYVDASDYIAIRYFEKWMEKIMNQDNTKARNANYNYRAKYPNDYICKQGLNIYKFEKDYDRVLEYKFFNFFPKAISSMPVTYDGNDVLRCNVTMSYVRYIMTGLKPNLADRPSSISTDEPKTNRPNTSPSRRPQVQPEPEPAPTPNTAVFGLRDLGAGSDLRPGAGRFTNTGTDSIFPLGRV